MAQDNVVLTSMTCKQYFSNILTGINCSWKQQLIDALCTAYSIPTDLTCEQVHNCETLTTLSEFTSEDGTVCIDYTDEHGTVFTRCFELEDSEIVITADNGLFKNTPTNVQLGGPVETPATLLHDSYISSNGFNLTMSGIKLNDDGSIQFLDYGVGTFADTPVYFLGVDASGNVIETTIDNEEIVITADNGLTKDTPTNVQLGSATLHGAPLLHDTFIDATANYTLTVTGARIGSETMIVSTTDTAANSTAFLGTALGSAAAIAGQATNGTGITGTSTGGGGGVFSSINGIGMQASSVNTYGGKIIRRDSSTGSIIGVLSINRESSGLPGTGLGSAIEFFLQPATGGDQLSNQIISKWTDATTGSRTSEFSITGVLNSVTRTLVTINADGTIVITNGLQNFVDDAAANVGGIPVNGLYRNGSVVQIRVS